MQSLQAIATRPVSVTIPPTAPSPCPTPQGDNTALHWASMRGHVEVVRTLVAAGADRAARNKQGCTPMDLCDPQVMVSCQQVAWGCSSSNWLPTWTGGLWLSMH